VYAKGEQIRWEKPSYLAPRSKRQLAPHSPSVLALWEGVAVFPRPVAYWVAALVGRLEGRIPYQLVFFQILLKQDSVLLKRAPAALPCLI
jgi:hypothetical protein